MTKEKRRYLADLPMGKFLFGVKPREADFIVVSKGLERIARKTMTLNYDIVVQADSGNVYFGNDILDYARRIPEPKPSR
jgi:hypothetical protein